MLNELNQFKTTKLEEYLGGGCVDEGFLFEVLSKSLARPEMLIIKGGGRERRDGFIQQLSGLLSEQYASLHELIVSKYQLIAASESLFDRLSEFIDKCDISKKREDVQVWSHIKRVESEFEKLYVDLERSLSKNTRGKLLSPYVSIESDDGVKYYADGASDHLIQYLSITIKLLSYRFGWFRDDFIVIPNEAQVNSEDLSQAFSIEFLARSWMELEDISQRSLVFGGVVYRNSGDDVVEEARSEGVKETFHFERDESEYELYDAIACERVRQRSLQNFMEIISNGEIRESVASNIETVGKLQDGSFLCEDEVLACTTLGDAFCIKTLQDTKSYHGLTIAEWIRSYFTIQYISQQIEQGLSNCVLAEEEVIEKLVLAGIPEEKCSIFISLVLLSKNSKDLYDCPLVRIGDDRIYVTYYSCINFNASSVILSRLSSLYTESSEKGYRFESEVNSLITSRVGHCKSFKFKRGQEQFEYDAVFMLDKRIFVLECKNRSLSWYSPVKAYRNKKYLHDTVKQVMRLKTALEKYPEVVRDHFGVDCSDYEVVPVILNCMPFSWVGAVDGVYVCDFSALSRLFESSKVNLVESGLSGQKKLESSYKQWKGSSLCSDDIIRHFERPVQVSLFASSRKYVHRWWQASDEVAFTVKSFEVDTEELHRQEKKTFKFIPVKNKRKSKCMRKKMIKKSRRKNRK